MGTRPRLLVFRERELVAEVRAPAEIAPRNWILGVVAVQVGVEEGRVRARVRAHATGEAAATVIELGGSAVVHVAFGGEEGARPPEIAAPVAAGAAARIALFLDGEVVDEARLEVGAAGEPRGFAHAFVRWLRDGGCEAGFDLTNFEALPRGEKYRRRVSRPLTTGQVVSFGVAAADVIDFQSRSGRR